MNGFSQVIAVVNVSPTSFVVLGEEPPEVTAVKVLLSTPSAMVG